MGDKETRIEHRSGNPNHRTPESFLDLVRQLGPIGLDPCSERGNPTGAKVHLFPPDYNGLTCSWDHAGLVYVNPPYGKRKGERCLEWVRKAAEEACKGVEIVMLLPARTDTVWFQELLLAAVEIGFIRGRLTFRDQPDPAPFPSIVVYFGDRPFEFREIFRSIAGFRLI
jgi:site-specific DNA-methyltransferase (adenine-specific)